MTCWHEDRDILAEQDRINELDQLVRDIRAAQPPWLPMKITNLEWLLAIATTDHPYLRED